MLGSYCVTKKTAWTPVVYLSLLSWFKEFLNVGTKTSYCKSQQAENILSALSYGLVTSWFYVAINRKHQLKRYHTIEHINACILTVQYKFYDIKIVNEKPV